MVFNISLIPLIRKEEDAFDKGRDTWIMVCASLLLNM